MVGLELCVECFQLGGQMLSEIMSGRFFNLVLKLLNSGAKASNQGSDDASPLPLCRNGTQIGFRHG